METTTCPLCKKQFDFPSRLTRHLHRKTKCKEIKDNSLNDCQCKFCMKTLSNSTNKTKHEGKCKYRNDEVRLLELQYKVNETFTCPDNECRFCNKTMRQDYIFNHEKTCKAKMEYKKMLKNEHILPVLNDKNANITININNVTNIANQQNHVNIEQQNNLDINLNPYTDVNTKHIHTGKLLKILEPILKGLNGSSDHDKNIFLRKMTKLIYANKAHPENHSILIPYDKRPIAFVWNGKEFEQTHREEAEKQALKTIADVSFDNYGTDDNDKRRFDMKNCGEFGRKYIGGEENCSLDGDDNYNKNKMAVRRVFLENRKMIKETQQKVKKELANCSE